MTTTRFNVAITITTEGRSYPVGYVWNHGFNTMEEVREFLGNYAQVAIPGESVTLTTVAE